MRQTSIVKNFTKYQWNYGERYSFIHSILSVLIIKIHKDFAIKHESLISRTRWFWLKNSLVYSACIKFQPSAHPYCCQTAWPLCSWLFQQGLSTEFHSTNERSVFKMTDQSQDLKQTSRSPMFPTDKLVTPTLRVRIRITYLMSNV